MRRDSGSRPPPRNSFMPAADGAGRRCFSGRDSSCACGFPYSFSGRNRTPDPGAGAPSFSSGRRRMGPLLLPHQRRTNRADSRRASPDLRRFLHRPADERYCAGAERLPRGTAACSSSYPGAASEASRTESPAKCPAAAAEPALAAEGPRLFAGRYPGHAAASRRKGSCASAVPYDLRRFPVRHFGSGP